MEEKKEVLTDKVTIKIEDQTFVCSRKKLSEKSDYFNAMFNGNFNEKYMDFINIQGVTSSGFENILKIMKDEDFIGYDALLDTLQCACVLQFTKIKALCLDYLKNDMRADKCLEIWQLTEMYDLHPICEFAKTKALLEFNKIKNSDYIQQISIKQLHSYLANVYLSCDNELDVFEVGMKWWYNPENSENCNNETLMVVLSCVDFKSCTVDDINQMLLYPDINNNLEVKRILSEIRLFISESKILNEEMSPEVQRLLNSKVRHNRRCPCVVSSDFPCSINKVREFGIEKEMNIMYFDFRKLKLGKMFDLSCEFQRKCVPSLKGFKLVPYKQDFILVGGEMSYGTAAWNMKIWIYRMFTDQWHLLTEMPNARRHFECCVINDKLYIIGGTGRFRVKLNNDLMYYDLIKDMWVDSIKLPNSIELVDAMEYKKKLLIIPKLQNVTQLFLFDDNTKLWIILKLNQPIATDPLNFFFTINDSIYYRGEYKLVKMKIIDNTLELVSEEDSDILFAEHLVHYQLKTDVIFFTEHKFNNIFQISLYNYNTKKDRTIIRLNDMSYAIWHLSEGIFPYLHYSLTETMECISNFTL